MRRVSTSSRPRDPPAAAAAEQFFRYVISRAGFAVGDGAVSSLLQDYLAVHPSAVDDEGGQCGLSESELSGLAETVFSAEQQDKAPSKGASECAICLVPFKHQQVSGRPLRGCTRYNMCTAAPHAFGVRTAAPLAIATLDRLPRALARRSPLSGAQAAPVRAHLLQALHRPVDGGTHDVPNVPHRLPLRQRRQRHLPSPQPGAPASFGAAPL
eukprot:7375880-Prymnesium_polylepis.1